MTKTRKGTRIYAGLLFTELRHIMFYPNLSIFKDYVKTSMHNIISYTTECARK